MEINNLNSPCCALRHLGLNNNHSKDMISHIMMNLIKTYAITGFQAVVMLPGEEILQTTLIELGFKPIVQFNRRRVYAQSYKLKMYFLEPVVENGNLIINKNKAIYPSLDEQQSIEVKQYMDPDVIEPNKKVPIIQ